MKPDFKLVDASEIRMKYTDCPIFNVEMLSARGTSLIDTTAKMNVTGHSLYKIFVEKGQRFEELNLHIGLANGTRREEHILMTDVDVLVENRKISTTFLAMPHARNKYTLFGMDFIERAKIIINVPQRMWYFADDHESHELNFENADEVLDVL
ncbi:hypothetical protein P5V15_002773 [Pogonomyrmex californicus]